MLQRFNTFALRVVFLILCGRHDKGSRVFAKLATTNPTDPSRILQSNNNDPVPVGLQQPVDSASTFPSAVHLVGDTLFIAGSSYLNYQNSGVFVRHPTCYFAELNLSDQTLQVVGERTMPQEDAKYPEACTAIVAVGSGAMLTGFSERPFLLQQGSQRVAGFTVDSFLSPPDPQVTGALLGLLNDPPAALTYPTTAVAYYDSSTDAQVILVMSRQFDTDERTAIPSFIPPYLIQPTESIPTTAGNTLTVHRVEVQGTRTFLREYSYFATTGQEKVPIHAAASCLWRNNAMLLVAGSSPGQARFLGQKQHFSSTDDMDGFISKFDARTGAPYDGDAVGAAKVLESVNGGNDWIYAMCHNENSLRDHVYIVGNTDGALDNNNQQPGQHAVLAQIQVDTLERTWTGGLTVLSGAIQGTSCAITPDGREVWWGGVIGDGGALQGYPPARGQDIFFAKVDIASGALLLSEQVGTSKDDWLTDISVDSEGNAVMTGNTFGSWFREKEDVGSDVMVFKVMRSSGAFIRPVDEGQRPITDIQNPDPLPVPTSRLASPRQDTSAPTPLPMPIPREVLTQTPTISPTPNPREVLSSVPTTSPTRLAPIRQQAPSTMPTLRSMSIPSPELTYPTTSTPQDRFPVSLPLTYPPQPTLSTKEERTLPPVDKYDNSIGAIIGISAASRSSVLPPILALCLATSWY